MKGKSCVGLTMAHHRTWIYQGNYGGQPGGVVRVLDLKSGDPKSHSNHLLDLFQVVPGSIPWLCLYIGNLFAYCQVGFLTCSPTYLSNKELLLLLLSLFFLIKLIFSKQN